MLYRRLLAVISLALIPTLLIPGLADARSSWSVLAATPPPQPTLALTGLQVWSALIGALVPLATYVLNHNAPWVSEQIKAIVLVIVAAVAGALTQLVYAGGLALNTRTLEVIGTAVVAALIAHKALWLPSSISVALGGGTNAARPRHHA
jgi:hypothetical protein